MKNSLKLLLVLFSCAVLSCNQRNAVEEAREQQQHDDSLKAAVVAEMNAQPQPNTKLHKSENGNHSSNSNVQNSSTPDALITQKQASEMASKEDELTDAKLQLTRLNTLLINAKTKLEFETNELSRAEQFHLGRLKNTREQEIRAQDLRVQTYQGYVQKIQDAIIQEHEKISSLQSEIAQAN